MQASITNYIIIFKDCPRLLSIVTTTTSLNLPVLDTLPSISNPCFANLNEALLTHPNAFEPIILAEPLTPEELSPLYQEILDFEAFSILTNLLTPNL